jgi:STE24 endopeptidase
MQASWPFPWSFRRRAGLAGLRLWLATRQIRHVAQHRDQVPAAFAATVTLQAHQKAADYTLAKARLGLLSMAFSTRCCWAGRCWAGWTCSTRPLRDALQPRWGDMGYQLALLRPSR